MQIGPYDIQVQDLVHFNATFNALSVACMIAGYYFIKRGEWKKHRAAMLSAAGWSVMFLITYVTYKANSGFAKFGGEGVIRPVYFTILALHVLGSVVITPLVPMTFYRALRGRFEQHRKLARWVWPLWMYVGVSGVVVYAMAVHWFPFKG